MLASCPNLYVLSCLSVAVLQRCVNVHCLTFVLGLNREVAKTTYRAALCYVLLTKYDSGDQVKNY